MFQTRGYGKCKGPEVEVYLVCSSNDKEVSVARTEGVRVGEGRKRNRGNSCTVASKAQKTPGRSGNYWRSGAVEQPNKTSVLKNITQSGTLTDEIVGEQR